MNEAALHPFVAAPLRPAAPIRPSRGRPTCRHCGAPLTEGPMTSAGFCCAGCAYVYRLVHEHGLEGYYRIKDPLTPPADAAVFQARNFGWLESAQQAAEAAAGDRPPELTLDVQGISCAGCVWLIERLFREETGARDVAVSAQLGQMRLRWVRGSFSAVHFARALQTFGYLLGPAGVAAAEPESRGLVRRIGLCTAFAMNVMLFTLPTYFGMERTFAYASLFGTLSFAFGTLSLLVGGTYFLQRAFLALRAGVIHLDLPIALGIAGAYLGSLYGWLTGQEQFVYFDFVAGFILLMLVGRWAQTAAVERNRRRLLSARTQAQPVIVETTQGLVERPAESLVAGEIFRVRSGHFVPVAGRLESPSAVVGLASINGEAEPRTIAAGGRVVSGATNLGRDEIRLRATESWPDSLLAQLLRTSERNSFQHVFLERIIRGYLLGILLIAALAGAGWWATTHDAIRVWSVVTAVLVVSCPCALGLALPLADEIATVALRRHGVFVRESDLWPRLKRIRRIVFDKTGTLTLEAPVLANPEALAALDADARQALLALVRDNPHPISQALTAALLAGSSAIAPADAAPREDVGHGVSWLTPRGCWTLGRPGWRTPADAVGEAGADTDFARDGVVLARFHFHDTVRAGAREEIARLQAGGRDVHLLSGDRREKVAAIAAQLGLPPTRAVAESTPAGKAAWIREIDRCDTLMLGDGANDSLAFDAAFVRGTPVIHRGILETKADFYYLGAGIGGIRQLFEIDAQRRRAHAALLTFSIAYNLLAVGLAVAGRMNPLLAAILMPVSSLLTLGIVLTSLRRVRRTLA